MKISQGKVWLCCTDENFYLNILIECEDAVEASVDDVTDQVRVGKWNVWLKPYFNFDLAFWLIYIDILWVKHDLTVIITNFVSEGNFRGTNHPISTLNIELFVGVLN
jgi:hypothetical protein